MSVGLILALVLAVAVGGAVVRGDRGQRVAVIVAVAFGALLPQVLAAIAGAAGSASALLSAGW